MRRGTVRAAPYRIRDNAFMLRSLALHREIRSQGRLFGTIMNLSFNLLVRITLFAVALFLASSVWVALQMKSRVQDDIVRIGPVVQKLLARDARAGPAPFDRSLEGYRLDNLTQAGAFGPFCITLHDLTDRLALHECFGESVGAPKWLAALMQRLLDDLPVYRGGLDDAPGRHVGEVVVSPYVASAAAELWRQLRILLAVAGGILFLNVLVYLPVRRALHPTDTILAALARLEAGNLSVRLPHFELIELERISRVFNHMAESLEKHRHAQHLLSEKLLSVREEERRHLAHELHDEFGQCLVSIRAETTYAKEVAREEAPSIVPCADSVLRTTARMMSVLQDIVHRLRPVGLDEFGLEVTLHSLVEGWNTTLRGRCRIDFERMGSLDDLPDNVNVTVCRLVQESLTNAVKHGQATRIEIRIGRLADGGLELSIEDNGKERSEAPFEAGCGLIGMHERVDALGGVFSCGARPGAGFGVRATLPGTAFPGVTQLAGVDA